MSTDTFTDPDTDLPDDAETAEVTDSAKATATKATRAKRTIDPAEVKRIAAKVVEISTADVGEVRLLATILDVPDNPIDLTVAVLSAQRGAYSIVNSLNTIANSDPYEATVVALADGRPKMRQMWSVLSTLDLVTGSIPLSDVKAAPAIARGAAGISDKERAMLDAAVALGKRN